MNNRSVSSRPCAFILAAMGVLIFGSAGGTAWGQAEEQAERDFAFAEGLYSQENYQLAAEKHLGFINNYPDHPNIPVALSRVGECYFRLDKFAEAVPYFERLTEEFPDSEEAEPGWLWLGDAHYQAQQYQQAAAAYEKLLERFPESEHAGRAAYWRGESYYHLGEYEQAVAAYQDALNRKLGDQEAAYALYSTGLAYLQLDRPQEAIGYLSQVLDKHADSQLAAECQYLLGVAYRAQKNFPAALEAFQRVLAEHANSSFAARAQARIAWCHFQQQEYDQALAAFKQVSAGYPDSPAAEEAELRAADCLFRLRRWDAAAELYAEVTANEDSKWAAEALYWLAITRERQGETGEALATYKRLVQKHEDSARIVDAYLHIGELEGNAGNTDAAIAASHAAGKAATDAGRKQEALAIAAWARYQKDQTAESLAGLEEWVKQNLDSALAAQLAFVVAHAHFGGERYAAAINMLEMLVAHHLERERLGEALYLLGACHQELEHRVQAEEFFRRVLAEAGQSQYLGHAAAALVDLYAKEGELEKAQQLAGALDQSGVVAEALALVLYRVGQALYEAEEYVAAIPVYRKAVEAAPDGEVAPYAQFKLAWAKLEAGDATAAEAFEQLAETYPDSEPAEAAPEGLLAVAEHLFKQEDYAQAEALYRQIIADFADSECVDEAQYKLAWSLLKQNRQDEAVPFFIQAASSADLPGVAADAPYQAARLLAEQEKYEQVAELLEPFWGEHAQFVNTPWALVLLGEAYVGLEKPQRAAATFQLVVDRHSDHPASASAFLGLGREHKRQERLDMALQAFEKAVSSGTGQAAMAAHHELATCYRDKRDFKQAAEEFLKVPILYADAQLAAQALYEAGQCYEQLEDTATALRAYKVITNGYSEQQQWVEKAQARLNALED